MLTTEVLNYVPMPHRKIWERGNAYRAAMEDIPADVKAFLREHPFLEVTEAKKVRATTVIYSLRYVMLPQCPKLQKNAITLTVHC